MFRVMIPTVHAGGISAYIRFGRVFKSREAALRCAAGTACACVINDHNECIAASVGRRNRKIPDTLFSSDGATYRTIASLGRFAIVERIPS